MAARYLECDNDALPDVQPPYLIPERDDLGYALVPDRKRTLQGEEAASEQRVDLAARDGQRPDQRVVPSCELGLRHFAPLELISTFASKLSHARSFGREAHRCRRQDCTRGGIVNLTELAADSADVGSSLHVSSPPFPA